MARAFLLVLDSFGIGAAPDAAAFGDTGANTFGSIADWCAKGEVTDFRPEAGALSLPTLTRIGLLEAARIATGKTPVSMAGADQLIGQYGACKEASAGKDTPSGHWEMAGVPVTTDWGYFPKTVPTFPDRLIDDFIKKAGIPGVLGNCHASGTVIINDLGDEHIQSGKPIVYTSADSVFQIAAHEDHFGLDRLYEICDIARTLVDDYNVGRVIARPFITTDDGFKRTGNRRDLAVPPPEPTLLDKLEAAGRDVISVGKIADIFAHQGLTRKIKATGNTALFDATEAEADTASDGSLIFTNFVDFDQEYGHRRNPSGYAAALELFDERLGRFIETLKQDDLVILTADHGCDPTFPGNDHTREFVPFLSYQKGRAAMNLGVRESFADIGQTIASHLGIAPLSNGTAAF